MRGKQREIVNRVAAFCTPAKNSGQQQPKIQKEGTVNG